MPPFLLTLPLILFLSLSLPLSLSFFVALYKRIFFWFNFFWLHGNLSLQVFGVASTEIV